MIAQEGEIASDLRKVEYNMFVLPSQIKTDKYIDLRLALPNGQDLIVVSHKKIEIPNIDGIDSENTVWMNLSETEILTVSCAIVESYKIEGSKLYLTEYVEPGLQSAATATYLPNDETINLIRNPVNSGLAENADKSTDNVVNGMEEEIQKTQQERQKYLESLGGSY